MKHLDRYRGCLLGGAAGDALGYGGHVQMERDGTVATIAVGYGEALSLAGKIVEDMYRETGGFCLEDFL